jgi:hypothetical protein
VQAQGPPPLTAAAIFDAYAKTWHHARDPHAFATRGTLAGGGLVGSFRSVREGDRLYEEQRLGTRVEQHWTVGDAFTERDANGVVRRWHGTLLRRARTQAYVDDDGFLRDPARARVLPPELVHGRPTHPVIVSAPHGDEMTLYFADDDRRIIRTAFADADGTTTVDYADFRDVGGENIPFSTVVSDGDPAYDLTATVVSAEPVADVDPAAFVIPPSKTLIATGPQAMPLVMRNGHYLVPVFIAGKRYEFLLDSGASSVVLDTHVAKELGLAGVGAFEAKGANRLGGVQDIALPPVSIGSALLADLSASSLDTGALRIDGILGTPFFAESLVELDFKRNTMRFGPPGSFKPRGARVALDTDRALPEAQLVAGAARIPGEFLVDTGNSNAILLYRAFVERHPSIVPFTASNSLTYGIGGATQTYRTKLDRLDFGGVVLHDRPTDVMLATTGAFADYHDAGNIGLGVLDDFVVTFDEANDALYIARG